MKQSSIPSPTSRRFWQSETVHAGIAVVGSVIGAAYAVYLKITAPSDTKALHDLVDAAGSGSGAFKAREALGHVDNLTNGLTIAIAVFAWVILTGGLKLAAARHRDKQSAAISDPNHLLGPLLVMYFDVKRRRGLTDSDDDRKRFRATLHKIEKDAHIQCVRYVGHTHDDETRHPGPHRRWPNHCGLVGKVARLNKSAPVLAKMGEHVKADEDYVKELMELYGYTRKEAKASEPMRLSALAVPITDGSRIIGVVYCDSSEREFFDEEIVNLCVVTSMAIAKQVEINN